MHAVSERKGGCCATPDIVTKEGKDSTACCVLVKSYENPLSSSKRDKIKNDGFTVSETDKTDPKPSGETLLDVYEHRFHSFRASEYEQRTCVLVRRHGPKEVSGVTPLCTRRLPSFFSESPLDVLSRTAFRSVLENGCILVLLFFKLIPLGSS